MPNITLPDGSIRSFDAAVTGLEIAADISKSLAKKAMAVKIDGVVKDAFVPIEADARVEILTRDSEEGLDLIRHDAAHLMAQAVQALFPGTQVTIGPNIEDGFFYDFYRDGGEPFSTEDLAAIEKKMNQLMEQDQKTRRVVMTRDDAIAHFKAMGETYKAEIIGDIPAGEEVSIYYHGDGDEAWHDLCRGPHLPSTKHIGQAFKLMKVAGAYWRGDSKNEMLQRIYGTAWATDKELKAYLFRLEEAEKRDHRKLGRAMDLFHLQEEAMGSVFWHDKGYTMWRELENYIRRRLEAADYKEVKTPQIIDKKFWEKSGHWEKFREAMFVVPDEVPSLEQDHMELASDTKLMALKADELPGPCRDIPSGDEVVSRLALAHG